nr:uncharacterized protein LOC114927706 [Arachis hypogaea]
MVASSLPCWTLQWLAEVARVVFIPNLVPKTLIFSHLSELRSSSTSVFPPIVFSFFFIFFFLLLLILSNLCHLSLLVAASWWVVETPQLKTRIIVLQPITGPGHKAETEVRGCQNGVGVVIVQFCDGLEQNQIQTSHFLDIPIII